MLKKIYKATLYLTVFILPWQTRYIIQQREFQGAHWPFGDISLYATDILIIISLGLALAIKHKREAGSYFKKVRPWLALFIFIAVIASTKAIDQGLAFVAVARLLAGLALIFMISSTDFSRQKLLMSFFAAAMLQGLLGLWQFFSQSAFASKWLGLSGHNAMELGVSVIEVLGPDGQWERWLRAYGGLDHPNIFGGLMAGGLVYVLTSLYMQKTKKGLLGKNKRPREFFWFFGLIVFSAGLFVSFSRSAILGVAAGLIALLLMHIKNWKKILLPVVTVITIVSFLTWQYGYLYWPRIQRGTRLEVVSSDERMTQIDQALTIIGTAPWLGAGPGNFGLAVHDWLDDRQLGWFYQPVHNVFLLVGAETGIIALAIFIIFNLLTLVYAFRRRNKMTPLLVMALFIMMFDHYFFSLHFGWLYYSIILGLALSIWKNDRPLSKNTKPEDPDMADNTSVTPL